MPDDSLSSWLALREDADATARSTAVTDLICDRVERTGTTLHVLDLGAGTGSNLRYLAPRLAVDQRWLLTDRDPRLLDEAARRKPAARDRLIDVETRCLDLCRLNRPELFAGRRLVTASALLDLVSESWLATLASCCRSADAVVLLALTYTGQSRCSPAEPEDERVRQLMNRHQHTDKGLGGPAEGPDAVDCAARCFAAMGYEVRREPSNWELSAEARDLQRELIVGWARAAIEIAPADALAIRDWLDRRLAHLEAGRSHIVVTHEDLAAWPA